MLNTSVGHDQLADGHAETLDEEQDVLVHLRVAGSARMGWRTRMQVGRSMCAGEDEEWHSVEAHHSNGHGSVAFRDRKRAGRDRWHRSGKWNALFVE